MEISEWMSLWATGACSLLCGYVMQLNLLFLIYVTVLLSRTLKSKQVITFWNPINSIKQGFFVFCLFFVFFCLSKSCCFIPVARSLFCLRFIDLNNSKNRELSGYHVFRAVVGSSLTFSFINTILRSRFTHCDEKIALERFLKGQKVKCPLGQLVC